MSICGSPERLTVAKPFGTDINGRSGSVGVARERLCLVSTKERKMLIKQIANRIHEWLQTRREIDRVHLLDDHLLADMGIKRHEIERRVKGR
jgi:uncharacterized protein YjiS (DUF1127 family)